MVNKLIASLLILLSAIPVAGWAQDTPGLPKFPPALNSADSLVRATDNATTKLKLSLTAGATGMTVLSTASFPSSGILWIDGREKVTYTGKTATTFTGLARGQDGTAALVHAAGVTVEVRVSALMHNTLSQAIRNLEAVTGADSTSSLPSSGYLRFGTGPGTARWRAMTLSDVVTALGYTPADSSAGVTLEAYGGNPNGIAINDTAFTNALAAASSNLSPLVLKGGVYLIREPLSGTAAGVKIVCPTGNAVIRKTSGGTTATILDAGSDKYRNWTFEGIEFDGNFRDAGVAAESGLTINATEWFGVSFINCKFRNFNYHEFPAQGSSHLYFNRCTFFGTVAGTITAGTYNPTPNAAAAYGSGVQLNFGSEDVTFEDCDFHFLNQGIATSNSSGADATITGVKIKGCRFRGDWWNSPYKTGSWTVSAVPNGATGDNLNNPKYLDVSTSIGSGFFQTNDVISFPVQIASGASFTSTYAQLVQATGIGTNVQYGDSLETADGRRAEIVGIDSANEVQIARWEDYSTYEATAPPANATAWRVRRYFATLANRVSSTRVELYQTPINPFTGQTILNAGFSLSGATVLAFADAGYAGTHITKAKDVLIEGNTVRGSWADAVSNFDSDSVRITNNRIALTMDEAITLTNCNGAVASNNSLFRIGTGIFIGSENVTVSNNSVDGWQMHYDLTDLLGAVQVNGLNTSITGNTFRYPSTSGHAPHSAYPIVFAANEGDCTGSVASNNTGFGKLGQVYIQPQSGPIIVRDMSISGTVANANALAATTDLSINSLTLPYDAAGTGKALKWLDSGGDELVSLASRAGGDLLMILRANARLQVADRSANTILRILEESRAVGVNTVSPLGALHVFPSSGGAFGLIVQSNPGQSANTFWSLLSDNTPGVTILNNRLRIINLGSAYNDNPTNFERLTIAPVSNVYTFASEAGGTGTARNFLFSGGTVGIGVASTGAPLEVRGSSGYIQRWSDGTSTMFAFISGTGEFGTSTNTPLIFHTNLTQRLQIGASGGITFLGTSGNLTAQGTGESSFAGNLTVSGLLKLGTTPVTVNDSGGRILPAAGGVAGVETADSGYFLTLANVSPGSVVGAGTIISSSNQVRAIQFVLPYRVVVGHITVEVTTTVASSLVDVGIYSADGATKLVSTGAVDTSSGTFKVVSVGPVTLDPGVYWYAATSNDATVQLRRITADSNIVGLLNNNSVKKTGVATNSSTSGVLPASLGSPVIATGATANLPVGVFER